MAALSDALAAFDAGWHPVPMPWAVKYPPPAGRTGYDGRNYTRAEIEAIEWQYHSVALRMPDGVVGFDFDLYKEGTRERANALGAQYGPLPKTLMSTARDDLSGIRFYRVPVGTTFPGVICEGVDAIQWFHRYAMCKGTHPQTGDEYRLVDEQSGEFVQLGEIWDVGQLPELPWPWIEGLADKGPKGKLASKSATSAEMDSFCEAHQERLRPAGLDGIRTKLARVTVGGRHDSLISVGCWAMREARAGWYTPDDVLDLMADWWNTTMRQAGETGRMTDSSSEFASGILWAIAEALAAPAERIAELRATAEPEPEPTKVGSFYRWDHKFPPPTPLIDGVIEVGSVGLLYARWGCFKSFLAIDWALSVATGKDWHGHDIPGGPSPVAILGYEAAASIHRRAHAWSKHYELSPMIDNYHLAPREMLPGLGDVEGMKRLVEKLDELAVAFVVVDTVARGGTADMNTHEADAVFAGLHALASETRAVIGIAHAGKDASRGVRGFSSQEDQVDLLYRLDRERDSSTGEPKGPATLTNPKAKDRETIGQLGFELVRSSRLADDERVLLPRVGLQPGAPVRSKTAEEVMRDTIEDSSADRWWSTEELVENCRRSRNKIGRPEVRETIERLVELEYLERDENDPRMVRRAAETDVLG